MTPTRSGYHSSWKIACWIILLALLAIGVIGVLIAPTTPDRFVNVTLFFASCSIGWTAGMMLSPDSKHEQRKFSGVWKGVSLFASGYLVSKIDPLLDAALKPDSFKFCGEPLIAYRLLSTLALVVFTALLVYVVRVYALTVGE